MRIVHSSVRAKQAFVVRLFSSLILSLPIPVRAQSDCDEPVWVAGMFGHPGPKGTVESMIVFDDGTSPSLYVGGVFNQGGGVQAHGILRWNGRTWRPVGEGFGEADGVAHTNAVSALAVFDDGNGPALYAGGGFQGIYGSSVDFIARWDGRRWNQVGQGLNGWVRDLLVFDDGTGPALFASGSFNHSGNLPASGVAKWNGQTWSQVGQNLTSVSSIIVFPTLSGERLVACGNYSTLMQKHVLIWDGQQWLPLGLPFDDYVSSLAIFDDGTGSALCAAGRFTVSGNTPCNHVAKWTGSEWVPLGEGMNGWVRYLSVADLGHGDVLIASGTFTMAGGQLAHRVAYWDGTDWHSIPQLNHMDFHAATLFDDGSGLRTYIGGQWYYDGPPSFYHIGVLARDGDTWQPIGGRSAEGLAGEYSAVRTLAKAQFDGSTKLFVGGDAILNGPDGWNPIAQWDGLFWKTLSPGLETNNQDYRDVRKVLAIHDGPDTRLIAGGVFVTPDERRGTNIAMWDGSTWTSMGAGTNGEVSAMAEFDDGGGNALFVGGDFNMAGEVHANLIAKWNGDWSAVPNSFSSSSNWNGLMYDMTVYNDGRREKLYLCGSMTLNNEQGFVYAWDGHAWETLNPPGHENIETAHALAVYDDGTGAKLYAGAFGVYDRPLLWRWDGQLWSDVPGTFESGQSFLGKSVLGLSVYDDGTGPGLYVAGSFTSTNPLTRNIARLDANGWHSIGDGTTSCESHSGYWSQDAFVRSVVSFNDGTGPAVFVGGSFNCVGWTESINVAKYGCSTWQPLRCDFDFDNDVDLVDFSLFSDCFHGPLISCYEGGSDPDFNDRNDLKDVALIQRNFTGFP